jgi:hypothetical protein
MRGGFLLSALLLLFFDVDAYLAQGVEHTFNIFRFYFFGIAYGVQLLEGYRTVALPPSIALRMVSSTPMELS